MIKSAKPTVVTINHSTVSTGKGSVFASVLVKMVTYDALFLESVEVIQIRVDRLHSST